VLICVDTTNCRNYVGGTGDGERISDALTSGAESSRIRLSHVEG
jgi:hypothetical protein